MLAGGGLRARVNPAGSRAVSGIPADSGGADGLRPRASGRVSVICSVRGRAPMRVFRRTGVVRGGAAASLVAFPGPLRSVRRPRGLQSWLPADGRAGASG